MFDPMQIVDRYEEVTICIEKRIKDITQTYDGSQTVRQWLSRFHCDPNLLRWDSERQRLLKMLPHGFVDQP